MTVHPPATAEILREAGTACAAVLGHRRVRSVGRALRHRNYRLFFTGQSISLVGTWLTKVATAWLVYRLTGSAWLLGVVGFAGQIPTFVLAPLAGVLVDRWNRRRVLLATQTLAMLQSAFLATLALSGVIRIWEVIALSVVQGLVDAFDMPVRQSLVVRMVDDRNDLPNAIALNSSMVNAARLLGPAIAGVVMAAVGEGWCFFIDAVSYAAVIVSVLLLRLDAQPSAPKATHVLHEMAEGFRYASGFAPLRALLLLLAVTGLAGRPFAVLLPVIAREVMHGGAGTLGTLQATAGVGALAGTLYLAWRTSIRGAGPSDRDVRGSLRPRPRGLLEGTRALARDAAAFPRRHRDDAADRGEQHDHPDHRR